MFDQYLRGTNIPVFQYKIEGSKLSFKWDKVVPGFAMPVRVNINGKDVLLRPTETIQSQTLPAAIKNVTVDRNFYVETGKIS